MSSPSITQRCAPPSSVSRHWSHPRHPPMSRVATGTSATSSSGQSSTHASNSCSASAALRPSTRGDPTMISRFIPVPAPSRRLCSSLRARRTARAYPGTLRRPRAPPRAARCGCGRAHRAWRTARRTPLHRTRRAASCCQGVGSRSNNSRAFARSCRRKAARFGPRRASTHFRQPFGRKQHVVGPAYHAAHGLGRHVGRVRLGQQAVDAAPSTPPPAPRRPS